MNNYRIQVLVERLFILAGFTIFLVTLVAGFYFNHYDSIERQKESIERSHSVLSQLVTPSLTISDIAEIRHLLYMASDDKETYLVQTSNKTIIMSDYGKTDFTNWISELGLGSCRGLDGWYKNINGINYLIYCSELKEGDDRLGLLLSFTRYRLFEFSTLVFYSFSASIFIFLLMIIAFRKILSYRLIRPLLILKDSVVSVSGGEDLSVMTLDGIGDAPIEVTEIKDAFQRLLDHLKLEYGRRIESEKIKALVDLAAGVAHDIRSPVVALDVITKDIQNIPEDQRLIIRHAATRIKDIANNLLTQYREKKSNSTSFPDERHPELISDILSSLLSEKRVQYRYHAVKFSIEISEGAYGKFSLVNATTFSRILSNIIDNSIEARASLIQVRLVSIENDDRSSLMVYVTDNGDGMPESMLEKITHGLSVTSKASGHGLGLINAIKAVEVDWSGKMDIKSTQGLGTEISVTLAEVQCPTWFLQELKIHPMSTIVIVDDDESIHQVWKERFKANNGDLKYIDYYSPEEFLKGDDFAPAINRIYLIDYEFINSKQTGLDIIASMNIADCSCLVTSRHEDSNLQDAVKALGLRIIPKTYAGSIPIRFIPSTCDDSVDYILIDNDLAIRSAWLFRARLKGLHLKVFSSTHEFKTQMNLYSKELPIYIDSNLDEAIAGEDFGRYLYEKGFKEIILTTGYDPACFAGMYWISHVAGKEPPF